MAGSKLTTKHLRKHVHRLQRRKCLLDLNHLAPPISHTVLSDGMIREPVSADDIFHDLLCRGFHHEGSYLDD